MSENEMTLEEYTKLEQGIVPGYLHYTLTCPFCFKDYDIDKGHDCEVYKQ